MYKSALAAGITDADFYTSTPGIVGLKIRAWAARENREWTRAAWTAWNTAMLSRAKHPPKLKDFLAIFDDKPKDKRIDEAAIKAQLRAYQEQLKR